jgi:ABC-2 type transport system ATP-binding protein
MIELKRLQKVIDGATVIDIDSLTVATGEVAALTGLRGQARTALLEVLAGQTRPTSGSVRVAGLEPATAPRQLAGRIGVLLADNALYPRLTVRENLAFYGRLYGIEAARIDEVLQQVGLGDKTAGRAGELSPGMARRLAFGRAILHRPSVLLLVEPFSECEAATVMVLSRLLSQLAEAETAVLILAAEIGLAASLGHTIYVVENSRLSHSYRPGEERSPDTPFKVPARMEGKVVLVNPADILYATTEDARIRLHTVNGQIPTHLNLTELEERLSRRGFFRAHRSYLVNLQYVKEIITYTRDSFTLVMDGANSPEVPLSKNAARELRQLLDY